MIKNFKFDKYIYWAPVLLLSVLNLYLSCLSWQEIRDQFFYVKIIPQSTGFKLRHIVQFAPLSLFSCFAFIKTTQLKLKKIYLYSFLIVFIEATLSEILQIFAPNRISAMMDILWSVLGGLIGLFISYFVLKIQRNNRALS